MFDSLKSIKIGCATKVTFSNMDVETMLSKLRLALRAVAGARSQSVQFYLDELQAVVTALRFASVGVWDPVMQGELDAARAAVGASPCSLPLNTLDECVRAIVQTKLATKDSDTPADLYRFGCTAIKLLFPGDEKVLCIERLVEVMYETGSPIDSFASLRDTLHELSDYRGFPVLVTQERVRALDEGELTGDAFSLLPSDELAHLIVEAGTQRLLGTAVGSTNRQRLRRRCVGLSETMRRCKRLDNF